MKVLFVILIQFTLLYLMQSQYDLQDYGVLFSNEHQSKYLWGTYKPNLYFAMKERTNTTDVFGLMWYDATSSKPTASKLKKIRHECKKEDNTIYYWNAHNGIDYGKEIITDKENNIGLSIEFVKRNYSSFSNQQWDVVIKGDSIDNKKESELGLVLYLSLEEYEIKDKCFYKIEKKNEYQYDIIGLKRGNEDSKISIVFEDSKDNVKYSNYQKFRKAYTDTWRVKEFIVNDLNNEEEKYFNKNETYSFIPFGNLGKTNQPNVIAIQFSISMKSSFSISVHYTNDIKSTTPSINEITELFAKKNKEFIEKVDTTFPISQQSLSQDINSIKQMTREAISNVLGGIGYFYGAIKVNLDDSTLKPGEYHKGFRYALEPKGLFTGTPCRSFFARGFEWDEGYHNILISKWDIHLSMDIINSWLSTMSATGWIPREQIRGAEAVNQVPPGFITQDKMIANPPTLIFPINAFINYYKYFNEVENVVNLNGLLKKCYDKLGLWFEWFEATQSSKRKDGTRMFQWYGRDSMHNYASGFDDLPRGMTPNIYEDHLDLNMWMIELLKTLKNLAEIFDLELISHFEGMINEIRSNVKSNLFDKELGIYSDFLGPQFKKIKSKNFPRKVFPYLWRGDFQCGVNAKNPLGTQAECDPYSDKPCCSEFGWCGNTNNHCNCEKCKRSEKLENRKEYKNKEQTHNPHVGYINLFPIIFGFIDINDTSSIENIMKFLSSENELKSRFGIRSLSKSDLLYHTGDDYWRGNIWINLNYLTLKGMYVYYKSNEKVKKVYDELRNNVIEAVYSSWKNTHTFYEQYEDGTGKGTKNRPFNGWTSLIVEIISEQY